jgi:hypothetical protein
MCKTLLRSESAIQELEVVFSCEERVTVCHPNAGNNVVLDETTKRLPRCWHQVLIISIGNIISLSPRNLIL